jgi:DeoR/GlpR family transcriptional regulator of sugar metabolism
MLLTEIKTYLMTHKRADITNIARHFDISPESARAFLEYWVRKGKVAQLDGGVGQCQSCKGNPSCHAPSEVYQWLDQGAPSSV